MLAASNASTGWPLARDRMTHAQVCPMPKKSLGLPHGFLRMIKRIDERMKSSLRASWDGSPAVTAAGTCGGLRTDEEGRIRTSGGGRDVLREEWRVGSSSGFGLSRWDFRRWPER